MAYHSDTKMSRLEVLGQQELRCLNAKADIDEEMFLELLTAQSSNPREAPNQTCINHIYCIIHPNVEINLIRRPNFNNGFSCSHFPKES